MNNRQSILSWLACVCTVVFIVLKLTKIITWNWWVVWSPLIGYITLSFVLYIILAVLVYKNSD